jgi:hypothetical protein
LVRRPNVTPFAGLKSFFFTEPGALRRAGMYRPFGPETCPVLQLSKMRQAFLDLEADLTGRKISLGALQKKIIFILNIPFWPTVQPFEKQMSFIKRSKTMTKKEMANYIVECKRIQTVVSAFDGVMPDDLKSDKIGEAIKDCEDSTQNVKGAESVVQSTKDVEKVSFKKMRAITKRVRSSVMGAFGDDSLEYERVGGKRSSERKKPSRKAKKDQAA